MFLETPTVERTAAKMELNTFPGVYMSVWVFVDRFCQQNSVMTEQR